MSRGKIVLLPFPFDDLSAAKVRPALCLTDPIGSHRHVIVAFITSQVPPNQLDTDLKLEPAHPDFQMTGLRAPSAVRLHRMMTVTTAVIQRELGRCSAALMEDVARKLQRLFSWN